MFIDLETSESTCKGTIGVAGISEEATRTFLSLTAEKTGVKMMWGKNSNHFHTALKGASTSVMDLPPMTSASMCQAHGRIELVISTAPMADGENFCVPAELQEHIQILQALLLCSWETHFTSTKNWLQVKLSFHPHLFFQG